MIDDAIGSENSVSFFGIQRILILWRILFHFFSIILSLSVFNSHLVSINFGPVSLDCAYVSMCVRGIYNAHTYRACECVSLLARHFLHTIFHTIYIHSRLVNVVWQRCRSNFIDLPADFYILCTVWGWCMSVNRVIYFRHFATKHNMYSCVSLTAAAVYVCPIRLHQLIEEKFHWHNETEGTDFLFVRYQIMRSRYFFDSFLL